MEYPYRLFLTRKNTFKLQEYIDNHWVTYKDSGGLEVEYNSWMDVLKYAGYEIPSNRPSIVFEELLLQEEREGDHKETQINGLYPVNRYI